MERRQFLKALGVTATGATAATGNAQAGSGTFILGYDRDREVTPSWNSNEFEDVNATLHKQNLRKGFIVYVFGSFDEPVQNEDITVTIYSDKNEKLKTKHYTVNGTTWRRFPNVWRYPDTVRVQRE